MSLIEFHHFTDNRPVSFAKHFVIQVEAHQAGAGSLVRLGSVERPIEMHLAEPYDKVMEELRLTDMERAVREWVAEAATEKV